MSEKTEYIVDALLFERGYYEPLLFLQRRGNLSYQSYQMWRNGEVRCLDSLLSGDQGDIPEALKTAARYAGELGLEALEHCYTGWRNASEKLLCLSEDKELGYYLQTHYQAPKDRVQMDIFMDTPATGIANAVIKSLATHNPPEVARQLKRLRELNPEHPQLEDFETLRMALDLVDTPISGDQGDELEWLEEKIAPLAEEILKRDALDYLIPQWWRLSQALQDVPFDPEASKLHCSYTYERAYDWNGVLNSVEWEKDWQKQSILLMRHAKASHMLNEELASIKSVFRIFWSFPQKLDELFETGSYPQLDRDWIKFQDDHAELSETDFPAWFLIRHPALIKKLPKHFEEEDEEAIGYQRYQLAYALLKSDQQWDEAENMRLRKKLQEVSPNLLKCYFQYRKS